MNLFNEHDITEEETDRINAEILAGIENYEDITFGHVYLKYSYFRIRQIMLNYFNCELRPMYVGYKDLRYRPYQCYRLVDCYTNQIIGDERGYSLDDLRYFLCKQGFPLHDKEPKPPTYNKDGRRKSCVNFLDIVNRLENPADCEVDK